MRRGRKPESYHHGSEPPYIPKNTPLNELIQIQRAKVEELDLTAEPRVCVSWSESSELLPVAVGDIKDNFSYTLAKNAEECGFSKLRTVQQAILPYFNAGCNLCLATGACSGKTVGYLLPLIQKVIDDLHREPHRSHRPRAIIAVHTRDKGKEVFNALRMLTVGLEMNICLSMTGMEQSHFLERDKADIMVISCGNLRMAVKENRFSLELLRILVLEGVDNMHSDVAAGNGIIWLRDILNYYDDSTTGNQRQLITVAEDISFLDSAFAQDRIFHAENTVVIDNGDLRLSPSNHFLMRVNNNTMTRAILELIQNYEQGKSIIVWNKGDSSVEKKVQEALESVGISYFSHHSTFGIAKRSEIQHRFALGERQVLIIHHCNQLRSLRFPGVKQIIHIGPPSSEDELLDASYNYSSAGIAFKRRARSVVLFNVENKYHRVAKVAEGIQHAPVVEGWPKNRVPQWAADFNKGKQSWTEEDAKAAEELWDLEEVALVPSQENYHKQEQEYDSRGFGYRPEMEQNWDCARNSSNAENSSFAPSSAPTGDNMYNNGRSSQRDEYSSYPQQRYAEGPSDNRRRAPSRSSEWNDQRAPNPRFSNEGHQGGSRFEEPNDVPEYDDFEEENIGYREFRPSKDTGQEMRTSSSSSCYQEPRYNQNDYSNRRDYRSQDRQEYNEWGHQNTYGAREDSRECYEVRQNQPYQQDNFSNQTQQRTMRPQDEGWDNSQMSPRQGTFGDHQERQGWQMENREPNRQQQGRQDFRRNEEHSQRSSGNRYQEDTPRDFHRGGQNDLRSQRNSGDVRNDSQYYNDRQFSDERSGNRYSDNRPNSKPTGSWENDQEPSPRDQSFQRNNWQQGRDEQRGNRFSGGNGRGQRNRFAPANRGKQGFSRTSSSQGQATGSWDDDSNLPKDLWPQHPNKCIPGQKPSSEAGQQSSWDDKIESSEEEKAEPKWSDWKVSSRKSVDQSKKTPIMRGASGSEEGQRKVDGNQ